MTNKRVCFLMMLLFGLLLRVFFLYIFEFTNYCSFTPVLKNKTLEFSQK